VNPVVDVFCMLATDCGALRMEDWAILREVCAENTTENEILDLVQACGLADDITSLRELMLQASTAVRRQEKELARARVAAPLQRRWEAAPAVEWFCFFVVSRELISRPDCEYLLSTMEDVTDLLSVAQRIVDLGFCEDLAKIQEFVEESEQRGTEGKLPPFTVFQ